MPKRLSGVRKERWPANAEATWAGARTPEELETLFEDALLVRDRQALAALFEAGAVLVAGDGPPARGGAAIARLALAMWAGDGAYVADPRRVVQARDIALDRRGAGRSMCAPRRRRRLAVRDRPPGCRRWRAIGTERSEP